MPTLLPDCNTPSRPIWRDDNLLFFLAVIVIIIIGGYPYGTLKEITQQSDHQTAHTETGERACPADTIASFGQPLVLCYHQVRDWRSTDSKSARTYIVPIAAFRQQMKMMYDNGYRTILPDQWNGHPTARLPPKPFILAFDDGTESQFMNALPELHRYGFKAVFFIMTVTLGKPGFMKRDQVRFLSDNGHLIGCHTWDHHNVRTYSEADWKTQLQHPTQQLAQITGKPVRYLAYPFGTWDTAAIRHLKNQKYVAAYQLSGPSDRDNPSFTIRRMLVDGHWPASRFLTEVSSFVNRNRLQP